MGLIQGYASEITFPTETRRVEIHNAQGQGVPVGFVEVSAATALVAHLLKPQLLKAVDALLDQYTAHDAALAPPERERAMAEAAAVLLLAERHEAAMVWRAIDEGLAVSHRSEIDPLAVLGLEIVPAPSRPPVEPQWPMVIERVSV